MSGSNPFRRSKIVPGGDVFVPPISTAEDAITRTSTTSNIHMEDPLTRSSPKLKMVRIAPPPAPITPAYSTTDPDFTSRPGSHHGSLLPEEDKFTSSDDPSVLNPFDPESAAGDRDGPEDSNVGSWDSSMPGSRFEENQGRPDTTGHEGFQGSPISQRTASTGPGFQSNDTVDISEKPRHVLDVDAFKRLLLTGDSGTPPERSPLSTPNMPWESSRQASHPQSELDKASSSNNDLTFLPQHSIEISSTIAGDTSRASFELSASEADDERRPLNANVSLSRKMKPPPPKTRRGKLLKADVSQPLSSPSVAPHDQYFPPPSVPPTQLPLPEAYSIFSPGSNSPFPSPLLEKPLPATEDDHHSYGSSQDNYLRRTLSNSKRPPTPPLTRRHSQMKKQFVLPASRNNSHTTPLPSSGIESNVSAPSTPGPKIAPPPPSRRHDRTSGSQHSEAPSSASGVSQEVFMTSDHPSPENLPIFLSSPPSRSPSMTSVKRATPNAITSLSSAAPPPPPPRRLRTLSKSSSGSVPTLAQANRGDGRDDELSSYPSSAEGILADLSRLQKEVDDLRGQYESRKASR